MLDLENISKAFDMPYLKINDYKLIDSSINEEINKIGPIFIEVITDENGSILLPFNNNSSVLS